MFVCLLIWFQGGDGFFNEILNGYLSSRHKAPYPPAPSDFVHSVGSNDDSLAQKPDEKVAEASDQNDGQYSSQDNGLGSSNFRMYCKILLDLKFYFLLAWVFIWYIARSI